MDKFFNQFRMSYLQMLIISSACRIVAALFLFLFAINGIEEDSIKAINVFGYLPEYRIGENFDYMGLFSMGLTHLIFFSLEIEPKTGLPTALDRLPSLEDAQRARSAANVFGAKLMISFGGNSRSDGFAMMTATKKRRRAFLDALNVLLTDYHFDGVDYNWEYPTSAKEWKNWGLLMKESKQILTYESATLSSNVVSFTMYLDPQHFSVIQHFDLLRDADFVHCMAYDAQGKHSSLEFASRGIELATSSGFDLSKFSLGLPFYGRHTSSGEPKTYYEIHDMLQQRTQVERKGKRKASSDDPDMVEGYFFNSGKTLQAKLSLAVSAGIGGVMIWEVGQDKQPFNGSQSLMHALHRGLLSLAQPDFSQRSDL